MYKYIINPKTNKKVLVNGKIGKMILLNYLKMINGGSTLKKRKTNYTQIPLTSSTEEDYKLIFLNNKHKDTWSKHYTKIIKNTPIDKKFNVKDLLDQNYDYLCVLIHKKKAIGYVGAIIIDDDKSDDLVGRNILPHNNAMNEEEWVYIDWIEITKIYQSKKLCNRLLSFMFSNLIKLNNNVFFLENTSKKAGGIPACKCYIDAGIMNNLVIRNKNYQKINRLHCNKNPPIFMYYYTKEQDNIIIEKK